MPAGENAVAGKQGFQTTSKAAADLGDIEVAGAPAGPSRTPGLNDRLRQIDEAMNPLSSQREDVVARMVAERVIAQYPTAARITFGQGGSDEATWYVPRAVYDADGNELSTEQDIDDDELHEGPFGEDDDTMHELVMGIDYDFDKHVDVGMGYPSMDLIKASRLDVSPPRSPQRIAADATASAYDRLDPQLLGSDGNGPGVARAVAEAADMIEAGQAEAGRDLRSDPELAGIVASLRTVAAEDSRAPGQHALAAKWARDRLADRAIRDLRSAG